VRHLTAAVLAGLLGSAFLSASCDPVQPISVNSGEAKVPIKPIKAEPKPALPAPKTTAEVEKLGIPVYKGSVIDDRADSVTVDEREVSRTYKVTLYSPADFATVGSFYQGAIKAANKTVLSDDQLRIDGKTPNGDEIEVMLGPASDHAKTLVLAWVKQNK